MNQSQNHDRMPSKSPNSTRFSTPPRFSTTNGILPSVASQQRVGICLVLFSLVSAGCATSYLGSGYSNTLPPPSQTLAPYAAPEYATAAASTVNPSHQPASTTAVGSGVAPSAYAPPTLEPAAGQPPFQQQDWQQTSQPVVRYQSPEKPPADSHFFVDEDLAAEFGRSQVVQEVRIEGNRRVPTPEILRQLKTRAGRRLDPDLLQQDVQAIWRMQTIRRVHGPFLAKSDQGILITFRVEEHPVINELKFVGNRVMSDSYLRRETGLEVGKPLNDYEIRMAREKIEELYHSKGHSYSSVEILESEDPSTVVFSIYEDERRTINSVEFEGNKIASSARLGVIVKSKPRKLWLFGGKLDRHQLDRDVELLRAYYYSLGYFNAKIGRELITKPDSSSVGVKFVINEGPRYRIRNIRFEGNHHYSSEDLMAVLKLRPEGEDHPYFNSDSMNEDVEVLRDTYGSVGHIFAAIQAQPHFLEQPGEIDLVYQIDEGKPYRIGRINVHIEGDGITKRTVVLNRITQQSGDLIDIRRIRQSERLLRASQLFGDQQNPNSQPRIVFRAEGEETRFR